MVCFSPPFEIAGHTLTHSEGEEGYCSSPTGLTQSGGEGGAAALGQAPGCLVHPHSYSWATALVVATWGTLVLVQMNCIRQQGHRVPPMVRD
jgi:hypothetical protein